MASDTRKQDSVKSGHVFADGNLERRFDAAFGVTRTETERNELLSQRFQELEQDIREAFWVDDEARIKCDYYERGSETTVLTLGKSQGWVMSLVNRQRSRKLDLLQISVDINNRIFERESKHEKINCIGCPFFRCGCQTRQQLGKGVKISRSSLIEDAVRVYLLYLEGSKAPNSKKTLTA